MGLDDAFFALEQLWGQLQAVRGIGESPGNETDVESLRGYSAAGQRNLRRYDHRDDVPVTEIQISTAQNHRIQLKKAAWKIAYLATLTASQMCRSQRHPRKAANMIESQ